MDNAAADKCKDINPARRTTGLINVRDRQNELYGPPSRGRKGANIEFQNRAIFEIANRAHNPKEAQKKRMASLEFSDACRISSIKFCAIGMLN
ncbi:hypothetical protein DFR50_12579 [Roseiarcus fermentans]|uniref:Uncharacterized protein n=1 Tax=Roseiarcus fermentans TaxID=1473586 RepID=A0A366F1X8_9HYPH|nr:hypothetical protein DFR50_12579 [Roseiarcus fermentans]